MKQTKRNHAKFLKSRNQSSPATSKRSSKSPSPKKKVPIQAVDGEVDDTAALTSNGTTVRAGVGCTKSQVAKKAGLKAEVRLAIYWPDDDKYYKGTITTYDAVSKKHFVEYDDGGNEWETLDEETYYILDNTANIGEVGYKFQKEFDDGWHHGTIVEIRPNARSGKRYRCHYKDGDCEDLSMNELHKLAKLTQTSQPRKIPVTKKRKTSSDSENDEVRTRTKKKRQASPVRISSRRRQTFELMEKVFAYDKTKSGVLYEAQVIKVKEGDDCCLKYFVHYKGYKESHRKWLSAEEMMKMTAANRIQFDKSRM